MPAMAVAAAVLLAGSTWAQCPNDDSFEDNDDCATANVASTGLTAGLAVHGTSNVTTGSDDDFWIIQAVPAGELLTVDVLFADVTGDIDLRLYDDPACSNSVDGAGSVSDNEQVSVTNASGAPQDYYLRVFMWSTHACNDYSLQVTVAPDPCFAPIDDGFDDNDSCATAAVLGSGMSAGLFVSDTDVDYYLITVPANDILTVDVAYSTASADVDLHLFDDLACAHQVDILVPSDGTGQVTHTNASGAVVTYVLKAEVVVGQGCNNYSLNVLLSPDPCLTGADDGFEDNDSCGSAAFLPGGTTVGLFANELDADYYLISVAANDLLTVDVSYSTANGDVDLYLYDAPGCVNEVDVDFTVGGTGQVSHTNSSGAAATFVLVARLEPGEDCNNYDLNIVSVPDPCLTFGDDSFEDNDTCATATSLSAGLTSGLRMFGQAIAVDDDYWVVQNVPTGMILTVDAVFVDADGDIDMQLFDDPACTSQIDGSGSFSDNESVSVNNSSGTAQDYYVRLYPVGATFECNEYDLQVTGIPDPCVAAVDDALEPNDSCGAATLLGGGSNTDLFVSKADEDYYVVSLPDGDTLDVHIDFLHTNADTDLYLFDAADPDCGNVNGAWLDRGFSVTDFEDVAYTNTSGSTMSITILVHVYVNTPGECNTYDMDITGSAGVFATPFCFGDGFGVACPCANESKAGAGEGCQWSGGVGAILSASGSNVIANDDLVLTTTQARPNQPSMLVQGSSIIGAPFKDGVLCMGNPTERVEVVILDASGVGSSASSIVTEGSVSPGDTRYYQQWFRDPGGISPCGTGSNFTQGLTISWI